MNAVRPHLLAQTRGSLETWAIEQGASVSAASVFARRMLFESSDRSLLPTDDQPSRMLLSLAEQTFATELPSVECVPDEDGSARLAVTLGDGSLVESVLIHHPSGEEHGGRVNERATICVSSQVGCRRACAFCETGRLGLKRNLSVEEIVAQVRLATREAVVRGFGRPRNVVFMGMGEPLDNLDAVLQSIEVLREQWGFGVSERRITVSTVGIVPKMQELFTKSRCNVALSLHALEPTTRKALLPVAHKWSTEELRGILATAPRSSFLQWTLIEGRNDSEEDAQRLIAFARGLDVRINLIPLNRGTDPTLRAPSMQVCRAFQKQLLDAGLRTYLRLPHGTSVGAACGQLAGAKRAREDEAR